MGNRLNKFILLMWKNWVVMKRRPIVTAFEIIFPVLICFILVGVRNMITVEEKGPFQYPAFDIASVYRLDNETERFLCAQPIVGFSPNKPYFQYIVTSAMTTVCVNPIMQIVGFDNAEKLNDALGDNSDFAYIAAAIQFNDDIENVTSHEDLPTNLDVTIRLRSADDSGDKEQWYTDLLYPPFQAPGPRSGDDNSSYLAGEPDYQRRGFLYLQHAITFALINDGEQIPPDPPILMNRFPYPNYSDDLFYSSAMETMVSIMIMFAFMYNYINTIRAITTEKERQLKESMKIMGLPGWLHWLAWFLRSFVILLFAVVFITIIVKVNMGKAPVFTHSDGTVLFVFFLLFICATITFSFLISVFFTTANNAAAAGSLVFFLTYLPYTLQVQTSSDVSLGSALGSSLLSNSALSFGLSAILKFEAVEEGIQWGNMWKTTSPDDDLTLGAIFLMLVLDTFLYLGIALYVEAIFPGEFGVPRPWYFLFTRGFWCNDQVHIANEQRTINEGEHFEDFTENLPIGIQLQNLSKTFGGNKAVNKLNLDMYEGHITVLLGHNGAGKTTTMSMITGMFPPTSGTAIVSGYDVRTDIESVRDSMGLCLQHNVLFDNLTVYEHLYFFGKLKGLQRDEIEQEIDFYIKLLELEDKRHALSKTLSGGMKRKLSVGMALCGKSKVVMLDEPTAGMDPSARRTIWNLLQKQKEDRTILLTTHFMDEADLLGDRIAIMTGGELQCCGSSYFLKKKYGAGYYLIMDVSPQCKPAKVTKLLQKYLPDVEIFSHVGSELTYQLSEQESQKFEDMLHDLETNSDSLGVQSYGMSLTTLEEVFMKVGADHDNNASKNYNSNNNYQNGDHSAITIDGLNMSKLSYLEGVPLLTNQFTAMAFKKIMALWRTWYLYILQVALPIILLVITVLTTRNSIPLTTFPSLELTLDSYTEPITLLSTNETTYSSIYKDVVSGHEFHTVNDIASEVFQKTEDSPANVKMHYLVGASFSDDGIIAWFNGDPYHATALSLGLVLNTVYKKALGSNRSIKFHNHPLPLGVQNQLDDLQFNIMGFEVGMELGYGLAFVASFYILFYVRERVSKSKHLQFVSGVNVFIFWGTSFLVDYLTYLVTMCGILITLAALQEDGYSTGDELSRMTVLLIFFGFFFLPFTYLISYLFVVPSTGFARTMLLGSISGIIGITAMQVLEIESLGLKYIATPLNWVLLFIPFYSVAKGTYDLGSIYSLRQVCLKQAPTLEMACELTQMMDSSMCCGLENFYAMSTPGIGRNLVISVVMSIVLFTILITNEFGFFSYLVSKIVNYNKPPVRTVDLEPDVEEENHKIKTTDETFLVSEYALVLRDVTKYYKNFLAVNGLCLGVKPYECFGLLGVNGAGKTSTFKMMTGDEQISYGDAWVNGLNIKTQQKKVQKLIGYCPQFDALLDDLTARETLTIFGLIRGVPLKETRSLGEHLAHEFDFFKHLDKKVKELSGGNKRKLSTALALIGDPPVIYLDEPTTGMDPATKRFLWTALGKLRDNGKCIILTSHSMEECEALCTRLAIMVNGTFQCLGSTQRLKNKFAQGFALTIKMKKTDHANLEHEISAIEDFIQRHFPGAELKEKYQELLSYQLSNNSIPWSKMFGILERSKKELGIEDYSLGQCSLEQVFLSFTKHQIEVDGS